MSVPLQYLITALIGYALGNIPTGMLIAKAYGIFDIRKHGSGNIGTTNVLRTLGWLPSVLTLLGDGLKAFISAMLGSHFLGAPGLLLGGFMAVVGHDFPASLGFKGGKGIAPSFGMIIAISPELALAMLIVDLAVVALTRYMSIASLLMTVVYPILNIVLFRTREYYYLYIVFSILAAALSFFKHWGNLQRLLKHEENRLDFNKISKISQKIAEKHKKK